MRAKRGFPNVRTAHQTTLSCQGLLVVDPFTPISPPFSPPTTGQLCDILILIVFTSFSLRHHLLSQLVFKQLLVSIDAASDAFHTQMWSHQETFLWGTPKVKPTFNVNLACFDEPIFFLPSAPATD